MTDITGSQYYQQIVDSVRTKGNYVKATRPNGNSFADPTFAYVIGETATAKGSRNNLCNEGLLHFADVPSMTLSGGSWPCRLFEVTPSVIVASDGHKSGAKSLTVVRELPAWMALGPNGRHAAAFIGLLADLSPAAWDTAWDATRDAAWDAARTAAVAAAVAAGHAVIPATPAANPVAWIS